MQRHHEPPPSVTSSRPALSIRRSLAADSSSNMLEVLRGDEGTKRRPSAQNIRVRDLGRTIKERGEVCQWIQNMRLSPDAPAVTTLVPASGSSTKAAVPVEVADAGLEKLDATCNAVSSAAPATGLVTSASGTGDSVTMKATPEPAASIETRKSSVASGATLDDGNGEEPSFEEQLSVIRQQQRELLERQRIIQGQLDRKQSRSACSSETVTEQKSGQEVQAGQGELEAEVATLPTPTPVQSAANGIETKRRRLKGSLASLYANRDEGTVGSLLWYSGGSTTTSSTAKLSNSGTGVSAGRQANLKQDNSSSISQLLSQTSCLDCQSCDSEFSERSRPHSQSTRIGHLNEKGNASATLKASNSKPPIGQTPGDRKSCSSYREDEGEYDYSCSTCATSTN